MKVMIDISIVPIGVGISVSNYVAECQKIIKASGLSHQMHSYGTNIEGEWDEVFNTVKKCHRQLHEMGVPRITASLRVGTRTDKEQTMQDKIKSVEEKLG